MTSWVLKKKFQFKKIFLALGGYLFRLIGSIAKVDPLAYLYIKRSLQMGNPTETIWPSETMPMVSRLLAGGLWNYSFFQFHRNYYFPYWAHRQYDPSEKSFIPRSHNVLSINQTHRNWLSISYPGKSLEACIDMAGSIMPTAGSYTIEFATFHNGKLIRPHDQVDKLKLKLMNPSACEIKWRGQRIYLESGINGLHIEGSGDKPLIVSFRPFNMEGPALIHKMSAADIGGALKIRGDVKGQFRKSPASFFISSLEKGDSLKHLEKFYFSESKQHSPNETPVSEKDSFGMLTASFLFNTADSVDLWVSDPEKAKVPKNILKQDFRKTNQPDQIWKKWFPKLLKLDLIGTDTDWFFTSQQHILTLWDYDSVTPGSFTYHHFWIRDAVVMMNAYMLSGAYKAVDPIFDRFKKMVARDGLFLSQAGEYDGNGQALWVLGQHALISGDHDLVIQYEREIEKMLVWISKTIGKHGGVLPPGFSAEHLGVADWYLWDNFWSLAGLLHFSKSSNPKIQSLSNAVFRRLNESLQEYLKGYEYYPAALGRKRDAGMIGSVAAVYPLKIPEFMDQKMLNTLEIIHESYFFKGGFFQENIHSGINPYLTIQVAEGFLILGKTARAHKIMNKLKKWTQKCFTFPEAVHPKTRGGCMGDGFHGWAFAEVVTYFRHCFLLELNNQSVFFHGFTLDWFKEQVKAKNLYCSLGILDAKVVDSRILISGLKTDKPMEIYLSLPKEVKVQAKTASYSELGIRVPVDRNLYIIDTKGSNSLDLQFSIPGKNFS